MPARRGYATIVGPSAKVEIDTLTCCHCNGVILLHDPATGARLGPDKIGGACTLCHAPTCPRCTGRTCTPFERRLEAIERGQALAASLGIR